jgi:hypothetical protein
MTTLTLPRPDVTTDEISDALRHGLGARYTVIPGSAKNWNPLGNPRPDHDDTIVIGTGSTRIFRAEVTITQSSGHTHLHITPGGLTLPLRLLNRTWIARKVCHALQVAPSLH